MILSEWLKIKEQLNDKKVYCEYYNGMYFYGYFNSETNHIWFTHINGIQDYDYIDYRKIKEIKESD